MTIIKKIRRNCQLLTILLLHLMLYQITILWNGVIILFNLMHMLKLIFFNKIIIIDILLFYNNNLILVNIIKNTQTKKI